MNFARVVTLAWSRSVTVADTSTARGPGAVALRAISGASVAAPSSPNATSPWRETDPWVSRSRRLSNSPVLKS